MTKITEQSWKRLRSTLYGKGVSTTHLGVLDGLFSGDIHETSVHERGIDQTEFENKIKWMRDNPSKHKISQRHIDILEAEGDKLF
jgi:hypothetical protein